MWKEIEHLSLEELEALWKYHNKKYWIDNEPEITDYQFDYLEQLIKKKNALYEKNKLLFIEISSSEDGFKWKIVKRSIMNYFINLDSDVMIMSNPLWNTLLEKCQKKR